MRTNILFDMSRIETNTHFGTDADIDVLTDLAPVDIAWMFGHELGHHDQSQSFLGNVWISLRVARGFDPEAAADQFACDAVRGRGQLARRRC
jgi:hypothetical protein